MLLQKQYQIIDCMDKTTYINHQLNTSTHRNSCRFSRAERFVRSKPTSTDFNYYISSKPNSRTCNFGFGNRSGNDTHTTGPSPNRYNVSEFPRDKRATTLGFSRDEAVFGSMINEIEKKSDLPPPGAYQTSNEKGRAYSLRMKLPGEIDSAIKKRVPGPGQYQAIEINPAGRYPISSFKNARCISFGTPQRPQTSETQRLGPGSYDVANMDSNFSDRRVLVMRRNTTKNFGTGQRSAMEDRSKAGTPGPGNYQSFSSFGESVRMVPKIS